MQNAGNISVSFTECTELYTVNLEELIVVVVVVVVVVVAAAAAAAAVVTSKAKHQSAPTYCAQFCPFYILFRIYFHQFSMQDTIH